MSYHEPWFDEAQAWLISRDATFGELFGSITHFEGHPPFWFIILMPFAKSGISFELGIKIVNFIFAIATAAIIIFKAPFRLYIRCVIPFTYFFFYQYGVISRPYSIMLLGFVLSAMFYRERTERPARFVAALMIICASSAFGMLLSAGIVLVWLSEGFRNFKKMTSIGILLLVNIMMFIMIIPFKDTYAVSLDSSQRLYKILYMLFIAPADAVCSYGYGGTLLSVSLCVPLTLLIYYFMFRILRPVGKRSLFFVPYLMFSLFAGTVYFSVHHLGIIAVFTLFIIWITADEYKIQKIDPKNIFNKIFKCFAWSFTVLSVLMSVFWTAAASYNDICYTYGTGRELADIIKKYDLEDRTILVSWHQKLSDDSMDNGQQDYNFVEGISALPYFNHNLYTNLNYGADNKCYLLHSINTDDGYIKKIISNKEPEILIGNDNPGYTFGELIDMQDYVQIDKVSGHYIWKDQKKEYSIIIYSRRDIAVE